MDMGNVVATPTPMLTNATLLPLATDPECGTVLLNGGGTWIGHVGPGLVFLLWGLWWTVNMFLANFRQSAVGKLYCSSSYYPSPSRAINALFQALGGTDDGLGTPFHGLAGTEG